jgi:hypothetical protein
VELKLNESHHLLAYADTVNLLRDNMDIIKENMETLINYTKEFSMERKVERTQYLRSLERQ